MLTITTNTIGGVLSLSSVYSFINEKNVPGLIFTPLDSSLLGDEQFIVFSEFKKKMSKNGNPLANIDHFCTITVTDKIYANKLRIGRIDKIIGPVTDQSAKYTIIKYYMPFVEVKQHNIKYDTEQMQLVKDFIDNLSVDNSFTTDAISIDPVGCKDIDDAYSYIDENNFVIHIADPNKISHIMPLDQYYDMYTSVYFGNYTYHLLPIELSEDMLSLIAGKVRPVVSVHFTIDKGTNIVKISSIVRRNICISKNLSYDEADRMEMIQPMMQLTKRIAKNMSVTDTHIMIEVLMLLTNNLIGEYLVNKNIKPLFRVFTEQMTNAEYSFEYNTHSKLNLKNYTHFTSPLRRVADYYTHQLVLETLNEKCMSINLSDKIGKINDTIKLLKIISNKHKHIYISEQIVSSEIYECKLLDLLPIYNNEEKLIGHLYKWYICRFDLSFYVKVLSDDIHKGLKCNEIYDLHLYKLTVGKKHLDKIYFEIVH
jgi:rRNA processing protein Gar1